MGPSLARVRARTATWRPTRLWSLPDGQYCFVERPPAQRRRGARSAGAGGRDAAVDVQGDPVDHPRGWRDEGSAARTHAPYQITDS